MNIFLLDHDIRKCARYHCDKHVIKMILECVQMLCTVCDSLHIQTPYRATHKNHPCVLWAGRSIQNWRWLKKLAIQLNDEYQYRYNLSNDHASIKVIKKLPEPNLPDQGLTEFPQVMPKVFHVKNNPVQAYRSYYLKTKRPFAIWTKRRKPSWWT